MRFITNTIEKGEELGAYEEALILSRINDTSPDTIWLWRHPNVMYLLKNSSVNFMDMDYAKTLNYPVVRSAVFPARPTSIVIAGNDFGLSVYCKNLDVQEMVEKYYVGFWKFVCDGLIELEHKGNDLVVNRTDRKILGMVNTIQSDVTAGHCMFSETIPEVDLEKMFKMPEEKFEDKKVKSVSERITSFQKETGQLIDDDWLNNKAIEYFGSMGINLELEDDFNSDEYKLVESLKEKHLSEEWVKYGQIKAKPDFE